MECLICGEETPLGVKVCPNCGNEIDGSFFTEQTRPSKTRVSRPETDQAEVSKNGSEGLLSRLRKIGSKPLFQSPGSRQNRKRK